MLYFNYFCVYTYAGYIISKCFSCVPHKARFLMGNYLANVLDYGVFVKNADESKEVHVYPDVYKPPFKHTYLLANLLIKKILI